MHSIIHSVSHCGDPFSATFSCRSLHAFVCLTCYAFKMGVFDGNTGLKPFWNALNTWIVFGRAQTLFGVRAQAGKNHVTASPKVTRSASLATGRTCCNLRSSVHVIVQTNARSERQPNAAEKGSPQRETLSIILCINIHYNVSPELPTHFVSIVVALTYKKNDVIMLIRTEIVWSF